jgi:flagellar hook-associated protein 2
MASPTYNVSGLASGIDTNSIVDKLVQLESRPLDALKKRQTAYQTQVSTLGDLASKLAALGSAARALASGGALGTKATSTNQAFSATTGSGAVAGSYDVAVTALAAPAKWRSDAFATSDTLLGGTLTLAVGSDHWDVPVHDGDSLADLAYGIRQSGAPVSAVILTDDQGTHLSVTTRNTGYTGATAASALAISWDGTGQAGKAPGLVEKQAAQNATFTVDGLPFTRQSNTVSDALPGTTFALRAAGGAAETLSIASDAAATQAKLQTYVDAYNAVAKVIEGQLNVTKDTDRATTLAGDGTLRMLQGALQGLGSLTVGASTVRSLADLGVRNERDGTLSIDTATLTAALGRDPAAVNALFSDATSGLGARVTSLVDAYTLPSSGLLTARQSGLAQQIRQLTDQQDQLQLRIDAYREGLMAQFTAMESTVSGLKNVGTFLTQQSQKSS